MMEDVIVRFYDWFGPDAEYMQLCMLAIAVCCLTLRSILRKR